MKKVICILMVVLMLAALSSVCFAASETSIAQRNRLVDYVKELNSTANSFTLTDADIQTAENFLDSYISENELTEEMVDKIIANIDEIRDIVISENVIDLAHVSKANRSKMLELANQAGEVVNVAVSVDTATTTVVFTDTESEAVIANLSTPLKNTGNGMNAWALAAIGVVLVVMLGAAVLPLVKVKAN